MADGSALRAPQEAQIAPELGDRPLVWRRPPWLWAAFTFAIGSLWPLVFLTHENGLAQLAAVTGGAALLLAFGALSIAIHFNRPPRLRRHIVVTVMICAASVAVLAPFVFLGLSNLLASMDGASTLNIMGISEGWSWLIAPLAFLIATPSTLAAALLLALFGFHRRKPAPPRPDLLVARRVPELTHDSAHAGRG